MSTPAKSKLPSLLSLTQITPVRGPALLIKLFPKFTLVAYLYVAYHHRQEKAVCGLTNAPLTTVPGQMWTMWGRTYHRHSFNRLCLPCEHLDPVVDVAVRVKWLYRLPDGSHKTVSVSSSKQQLPQGEGGWIQINVTEFVSYWFSSFTSSLMSVVEVLDSLDDKMTLTEEAEQLTEVPPILEVSAVKRRHRRRSRRSLGMDCDGTKDEKRCCRYPLTVDFEKFGWDWIIAPKKYEANDCSGECPYVFLQKYPYTHIASMENKTICCAPRKMSSISMLYFDKDSNILLSTLPGMVVETCGCF